jgi:hypothetical protein
MVHLRQPTEDSAQAKLGRATLEVEIHVLGCATRPSARKMGHPPRGMAARIKLRGWVISGKQSREPVNDRHNSAVR